MRLLVVPGYTNSGPDHWQSRWERSQSGFWRVEQESWDDPRRVPWVEAVKDAVGGSDGPVVFVAHSLGCIAVVHAARELEAGRVAGTFLVAPADAEAPPFRSTVESFRPIPRFRLPFPSLLVASSNDPFLGLERAYEFAGAWGSKLVEVGDLGHINTASGCGPWPEGERLLADFLTRVWEREDDREDGPDVEPRDPEGILFPQPEGR